MLELWEVGYHKREFFFVVSYEVFLISEILRSSLIYYTSARHERNECYTNDTMATRVKK